MAEEDDFEEAWATIRVRGVDVVIPQAEGPESVIDRAISRAKEKYLSSPMMTSRTPYDEVFKHALPELLSTFAKTLFEEQRRQDSSVLIHLFLEASDVPVEEVKGFVRALPRELIDKILARISTGPQTGLQALLSLEQLWRDRSLRKDYELQKMEDGEVRITCFPDQLHGRPLNFVLRELFPGSET